MRRVLAPLVATALALAGCVTPPDGEDALALEDAAGAPVEPTVLPIAFEGSTYTGVVACPLVACVGRTLTVFAAAGAWFDLELDGTLRQLDLTLAWSAQTPASEEMRLGLSFENDEGDWEWIDVTGTSPLVLSATDLRITAEQAPAVFVSGLRCGPTEIVCVSVQERFAIEGTLTTTPR